MQRLQKILVFIPFLTRGGAEVQGLLLAKGLKEIHGYDVEVCAFKNASGNNTLISELREAQIRYFELPFSMNVFAARKTQISAILSFTKELRSRKIDVVIPFTWFPNLLSAVCFRLGGADKCFWNQRNVEDHVSKQAIERFLPTSKLIYVSNSTPGKKFIERRFDIKASDITIIKNGLRPGSIKNDKEYWLSELNAHGKQVVVMLANFFFEKDFNTVIKAFAKVVNSYPDALLVFAGGGGSAGQKNEAKALAFDLGLCKTVKFLGSTDDVPGLLAIADVGVLSSSSEGTPNSLLEYMYASIPSVVTNIEGITDVVGKDYGYLFDVGDDVALQGHLLKLLGNREERLIIGSSLKKRVVENYAVDNMVTSFVKLITHG